MSKVLLEIFCYRLNKFFFIGTKLHFPLDDDALPFSLTLAVVMASCGSTRLFGILRGIYRMMGIGPPQDNALNPKNLFFFLSTLIGFLSVAAYFLFKAHSVEEYVNTFHAWVTSLVFLLYFLEIVWHMPTIMLLIQQFEDFIEKSE